MKKLRRLFRSFDEEVHSMNRLRFTSTSLLLDSSLITGPMQYDAAYGNLCATCALCDAAERCTYVFRFQTYLDDDFIASTNSFNTILIAKRLA